MEKFGILRYSLETTEPIVGEFVSSLSTSTKEEPSVTVLVRFTKCLYAQLMMQSFYPPRNFGKLPASSDPNAKAFNLGIKLTCGFEMLYQKVKK